MILPIMASDLRDDKQFFIDHPGAVPITTAQVKTTYSSHDTSDSSISSALLLFG